MVNRYQLAANGHPIVSGTLALVVPQALAAARTGKVAVLTGPDGRTARVNATPPAIELTPPSELFPTYDTATLPPWIDRATELVNQL